MDAEGRGSYVWTPTTSTSGATALVRVVANNASATTGTSAAFPIAVGGTSFYVSSSTTTAGNQYTTALGNNANSGKSPSAPMASVEAVLNDYQPGTGDTIYVDNGTYTLFHNINIPAIDSGVTLTGPTASGAAAVLNRNSIAANDYVFCFFDGANNVTLEHLSITGANTGVYAPSKQNLGNSGITIADNVIYSDNGAGYSGGIFTAFNSNWTVTGNVIHDNSGYYGGVYLQSTSATITSNTVYNEPQYDIYLSTPSGASAANNVIGNNTVYGSQYGIWASQATVSNNTVHDNTIAGIDASNYSVVTGNTVWRQTATNAYGIEVQSAAASGNAVFGNYNGIYVNGGGATIDGNRIYSNTNYGLLLENMNGANYASGPNYYAAACSNVIYANSTGGIYLSGDLDLSLLNNTVYQPVGNAVTLSGSNNTSYPVFIENNILWVQAGYDLYVPTVSQAGLVSNYNILYHTGNNANVGTWNGAAEATLAAWQSASALDSHSSEANPQFVDPSGADAVLGYNPTAQNGNGYNGGDDDNFFVSAASPAIGAGNPAIALPVIAPAADALGYAFHLDVGAYAYRGTAAQSTTPPAVTSVAEAIIGPTQITVVFSQTPNDIDAAAASLYSLVGAGPDGIFGTSDDIVYSLTPTYQGGTSQVTLTINSGPLPTGLYQLTIASNATSSVHNLAGLALAGAGGVAGTNYVKGFTAGPTAPTITWAAPNAITYGTALSGAQLDASAGTGGSFAYSPASGTVLVAGTQTLSVTFTPTDTTDYTTATGSVQLVVNRATPAITLASPATPCVNYDGTSDVTNWAVATAAGATGAAAPTGGATLVFYQGSAAQGTPLSAPPVATGTYTVVAQYAGDGNYLPATSNPVTFTVRLPGDTNLNGVVNAASIDAIYVHFGASYTSQWKVYPDTKPVGQEDVTYEVQNILHTAYGDANLDCRVDFADFQILLDNWIKTGCGWAGCDFNGDGVVDFGDFQILLDNWNPLGIGLGASEDSASAASSPATINTASTVPAKVSGAATTSVLVSAAPATTGSLRIQSGHSGWSIAYTCRHRCQPVVDNNCGRHAGIQHNGIRHDVGHFGLHGNSANHGRFRRVQPHRRFIDIG